MRNLCLLSFIILLFGCQNQPQTTAETKAAASSGSLQSVAPKTIALADSIKPRKNTRFSMNRSRPKNKVDANFPYDIDLKTVDGSLLKSNEVLKSNDKPTILLFWLTTCYPCSLEMAAIQRKYENWQKEADFELVAISTDFEKNYPKFVQRVNEKKWPWRTYNDVNREFRHVMPGGLNGLPQTFLLDKDGNIVYHKRKYSSGDEDVLFAKVKELANM